MPRFYCPTPLASGQSLELPAKAARHIQVLRLQPGADITLFTGEGGEFKAVIERMGRSEVRVIVKSHHAIEREAQREVHLAAGMPANERMEWLLEKATELGVSSIQPLQTERSVLKLQAERAQKKLVHWQGICVAACEQCGRNRVPVIHEIMDIAVWLDTQRFPATRALLSLNTQAGTLGLVAPGPAPIWVLSGPEGGLAPHEENEAIARGFTPVGLGTRVLRAETAALAALAALALCNESPPG